MPGRDRYRLTYFPFKGRGELIRLIFHGAGVPFVDRKVSGDEWYHLKPKTPNGMLPVLEIDSQAFDESHAIAAWAARKFGLMGKTDGDELKTQAIMIETTEFREKYVIPCFLEKDPDKAKHLKKSLEGALLKQLNKWESIVLHIESNNRRIFSYMVTTQLTAGDLSLLYMEDLVEMFTEVDWDQFPRLASVLRTVKAVPSIKEYLATRDPPVHATTQTEPPFLHTPPRKR